MTELKTIAADAGEGRKGERERKLTKYRWVGYVRKRGDECSQWRIDDVSNIFMT